ncbi:MAG: cell division/cell wall cluster transcriptional repressor MraZ [Rubellimicrobium sp.]|nr:cell division/cell wall cluster transcriptional repressor MraZ [Rubellimicrobium sp.]
MSIPAEFRRVLEAGDPAARDGGALPALYLQYGPHLKGRLMVQTVDTFNGIMNAIMAIRPRTAEEAEKRRLAQVAILGNALRLEVDRDGRTVLPQRQREKLGLSEGEVVFLGLGDNFEIWPAATYESQVAAPAEALLEEMGAAFDPMTAIYALSD